MRNLQLSLTVLTCVALLGAASTSARAAACGDTITTSTVLDTDVTGCNGDALTVDANGASVTLDLNGKTVSCSSTTGTRGIVVADNGGKVMIKDGTVSGCEYGVIGAATTNVKNVTAAGNWLGFQMLNGGGQLTNCVASDSLDNGFDLESTYKISNSLAVRNVGYGISGGGKVSNCQAINNQSTGFFSALTATVTYVGNLAAGNPTGFYRDGPGKFTKNTAAGNSGGGFGFFGSPLKATNNTATGNTAEGFNIPASGNELINNRAYGNANSGFLVDGNNNTLKKNQAIGNGDDGFHAGAASSGNTIQSNTAYGNADMDGYDGTGMCVSNTWLNNNLRSVDPSCID